MEERAQRLEVERDQQAVIATAAERTRIARELHDIVSHNLSVVITLADAAAVVTELMTNALRHALPELPDDGAALASWPIRLGLADPGPYVICAVADPSTDIPAPRHSDWQDEAGRGLLVVASLSDQWGYCAAPADHGKVVWAAFATASPSR